MKMSVGVDLHKGQFTVYWRREGSSQGEFSRHGTSEVGFRSFESRMLESVNCGETVRVAVESTGNTRYFVHRVEQLGVEVVVINTAKFRIVTESVKKTDRHDAATIAEFLEKDMLPETRLCSPESEELRRLVKTRTVLVRSIVAVKNQLHGMLLSLGIETKKSGLQSKKERRRVLSVLEEQHLSGWAVKTLMETIDGLYQQVKQLEKLLAEKVANDRMVELIKTIPGAGLITAATVRAFTDDINRFSGPKRYASYAGSELCRAGAIRQYHETGTGRTEDRVSADSGGDDQEQAQDRNVSSHGTVLDVEAAKGIGSIDNRDRTQVVHYYLAHAGP